MLKILCYIFYYIIVMCLFVSLSLSILMYYFYFRVLQSIGEGLRVDAVDRRCKINSEEVSTLLSIVSESTATLTNLKGK